MLPGKKKRLFPKGIRGMENLHIVFWLVKDMSWAMLWRPLGIAMIVPTIGRGDLYHLARTKSSKRTFPQHGRHFLDNRQCLLDVY